jgi:hypothetical protein
MNPVNNTPSGWTDRVSDYLDQLEICAGRLEEAVDEMRFGSKQIELDHLDQSHQSLATALVDLESLIVAREELIHADDAPGPGISIRNILGSQQDDVSKRLNERCRRVARDLDISRERAVALFVCQFHLAELSQSLLSLFQGGPGHLATYSNGAEVRRPTANGGTLLNKSA